MRLRMLFVLLGLLLIIPVHAHAVLITDGYIGSNARTYGDRIGDVVFEVYSMDVTFGGGFMDVKINTNYKPAGSGFPTYGTTYGDLFISTDGWNPFGTAPYTQDNYTNGERWEFVFDTSAGTLYGLPAYDSSTINHYITLAASGGGYIERDGQEVLYVGDGTAISNGGSVDLSHAGAGGWISYSINLDSLGEITGGGIGLKWGADCANDTIEGVAGVAPVPEPGTILLLGTGLIGLAGVGRKKIFR